METVRCANCGFLALRNRQTREMVEVEVQLRTTWEMPAMFGFDTALYLTRPICFEREKDFEFEVDDAIKEANSTKKDSVHPLDPAGVLILPIINRLRECTSFTEWQHGHTPREHKEMQMNAKMLEAQRTFHEEQRRNEQESQERRDREQRDWQSREHSRNRRVTIIFGILATIVTIAATVVSIVIRFG